MIDSSAAYKAEVVGNSRRINPRAVVDLTDPDMQVTAISAAPAYLYSNTTHLPEKDADEPRTFATLEPGRWRLDGSVAIYPDAAGAENYGYITAAVSGETGAFSGATSNAFVDVSFTAVDVLQAITINFSSNPDDGVPANFLIMIYSGGTVAFRRQISGNTDAAYKLEGFTANRADRLKIVVQKMSKPFRRLRITNIIIGIYEVWGGDIMAAFAAKHQADISGMSAPYGTLTMSIDNTGRRFDPANKQGLFRSIAEGKKVDAFLGVGGEYKKLGTYYHHDGGWNTGSGATTMQWRLVDIVGLLAGQAFSAPSVTPRTVEAWAAELVAQIGLPGHYTLPPDVASMSVSPPGKMERKTCAEVARLLAMYAGTWISADAQTGYLIFRKSPVLPPVGSISWDNMLQHPEIKAGKALKEIVFNRSYPVVVGTTGSKLEISNPFVQSTEAAQRAASVVARSAADEISIVGRGDPTTELGDVLSMQLYADGTAIIGAEIRADYEFSGAVMPSAHSVYKEVAADV